jgi:hypothetical protein
VSNTANFNTFMGSQPSADDLAAIQKMADEQTKRTQELLKQQKKLADDKAAALKGESEQEQRARKLREAKQRRDKDDEDRILSEYDEKLKKDKETKERKEKLEKLEDEKLKREETAADKLKKSPILDVLPEKIQTADRQDEPKDDKNEKGLFSKLGDMINTIPQSIKDSKKQQDDGEQKNLGETIQRVSFHPEGIKILRNLFDPIYKSLNAFTVDMDKGLKGIVDKMDLFFTKGGGWLKLLTMGIIADIIYMWEKVGKMIKAVKEMPLKIWETVTRLGKQLEEVGLAVKKFFYDWPISLLKKMGVDVEGFLSRLYTNVVSKLESGLNGLKQFGESIMERLGINKLFKNITSLKNSFMKEFEPIINAFKDTGKVLKDTWKWIIEVKNGFMGWIQGIGNMFKGEGALSGVTSVFKNVIGWIKNIQGPIQQTLAFLRPVTKALEMFLIPLKLLLRFISIPVIQVLDGIITGVKTFLNVFNDDALSPIQKAVATVAGFFGGLGSLISDFVGFIGTVLKVIGKIPLLGFVGKAGEAVSSFAETIDTHKLGQSTVDLMHSMGGAGPIVIDGYKTGKKYLDASPEERKKIDERYASMSATNGTKPEAPKANPIIAPQPAPSEPKYEPAPSEITVPTSSDAQGKAFDESTKRLHTAVQNLSNKLTAPAADQKNGTTIINNNSSQAPKSDNKDYLYKPVRDANYEKRMSWWGSSMNYRATV